MLNLLAALIPGKSAAGFFIGQRIDDVRKSIGDPKVWKRAVDGPLGLVLKKSEEWISFRYENINIEEMIFRDNFVRLQFNGTGVLFNIFVEAGYEGLLWSEVKIGGKLSTVLRLCKLEYSQGDEMHYPVGDAIQFDGVAFGAEECPLDESPDQLIHAISIHDWSLQD